MELSMKVMGEQPMHPFDAWNSVQPHYVQEAALAYGELVMIKESVQRITLYKEGKLTEFKMNADSVEAFELLLRIDSVTIILHNLAIILEGEFIEPSQVQFIRNAYSQILEKFKRHAIKFSYSMYPPENMMESMLAPADGDLYKSILERVYAGPGVFERSTQWKELIHRF
jgi:hypothetical protein